MKDGKEKRNFTRKASLNGRKRAMLGTLRLERQDWTGLIDWVLIHLTQFDSIRSIGWRQNQD